MRRSALWLLHWCYRGLYLLSAKHHFDGITFALFLPVRGEFASAREKVVAALTSLRATSPQLYKRVRKYTPRIFGFATSGVGQYLPDSHVCVIDDDLLAGEALTVERLACTLVHEATHARLLRSGIPYNHKNKFRVERICTRAELDFASALPDGADLVAELRQQHADAETLWSAASRNAADFRRLRKLEAPEWLVRWLERATDKRASNEEL